MKGAATIVLAAVGLHCGGRVDPSSTAFDELTPPSEPIADTGQAPPPSAVEQAAAGAEEEPAFSPMFVRTSAVTRARGEAGETYVAGVFSGRIPAGEGFLESRGGDDVFVARVEAGGEVAWARSVGSKGQESRPEVEFEEGKVRVFAFTTGQADCGGGPVGTTWSSPMFFLCTFSPRGELVSGGIFPSGSP
jgi:hypothetical protein